MHNLKSDPPTSSSHESIRYFPACITLLLMVIIAVTVTIIEGGDPLSLARIGTRYGGNIPGGTEGYDGQFVYYIARDFYPTIVAVHLDVPAYRYQRILLPLSARLFAMGREDLIPWTIPIISIIFHALGTFILSEILAGWGISRWYALVYGLWVGFGLAIRLDLPEPMAYALVISAIYAEFKQKHLLVWVFFGLALFAKEVTIFYVIAAGLAYFAQRRWKDFGGIILISIIPFLAFQVWLWITFGSPGLGSGGAMATPFELIPFMGLLRIGYDSSLYLGAMLVVFAPAIVFPALWGIIASIQKLLQRETNMVVLALLLNSLIIAFLPFSTFRETGGLLRYSCGLVLAIILFSGKYHIRRALNYSWFWLSFNVFLIKTGGLVN